MKKQHKIQCVHNRKSAGESGWIGLITDEERYEQLKNGEIDWKDTMKPRMTDVQIPASLFYRLMALDMKGEYDGSAKA